MAQETGSFIVLRYLATQADGPTNRRVGDEGSASLTVDRSFLLRRAHSAEEKEAPRVHTTDQPTTDHP